MTNPDELTGAELDAAVAVEVMEWEWHDKLCCWYPPGGTLADSRGKNKWQPSSDWNAMREVVEKMRELCRTDKWKPFPDKECDRGPWFAIDAPDDSITHECRVKGMWTAGLREFANYEGDQWVVEREAQGETAPIAVCRAALKAVRGMA